MSWNWCAVGVAHYIFAPGRWVNAIVSDSAPGASDRSCDHVTPAAGLTSDGNGRKSFFRQATQRDRKPQIALEHKPTISYRAVRMVKGGMTQAQVARELGINVATIRRWLARDRSEEALENCTGWGRSHPWAGWRRSQSRSGAAKGTTQQERWRQNCHWEAVPGTQVDRPPVPEDQRWSRSSSGCSAGLPWTKSADG